MDYVRDELVFIVTKLRELEKSYIKEMSSLPPGSLTNNISQGKPRLYHSIYRADGTRQRIHLKPDDPMIGILARKEYLRHCLAALQNNIKLLSNTLSRYSSLDPGDIIAASRRAYRLLSDQSFFTNQMERDLWDTVGNLETLTDDLIRYRCEDHKQWAEQEYPRNTYQYRGLFLTSFGLRVRSRGEIVIAEQAHTLGIPFRHDQLIELADGSVLSPDFTFEDKYYEEFYLDYCGMMDDPYYVRKQLARRKRYERNGINEWTNIRYIYSKDDSLNAAEVKHILLDWVVPKL